MISIEQKVYAMTEAGEAIIVYTMRSENGSEVEVCNLGATILSVKVPDRDGKIADVALGYPDYENMIRDCAFVGRSVGRVANRIARGRMTIEGKEYALEINNGQNHLHGGNKSYAVKIWESRVETNRIVMSLHSEDGDQGYPGAVDVEAIFDFDDDYALEITYRAVSNQTTVVNLTNHAYFNLAGSQSESVLDHELKLNSEHVLEMNEYQIPTGEHLELAGSPMDFRDFAPLKGAVEADFNHSKLFRGLDHFFVVKGWQKSILSENAVLRDPASGRTMTVLSSAPGLMVYTGNWLAGGSPVSKSGKPFSDYQGVALECQIHPNAVNTPSFPSVEIQAGEQFCQKIVFKFGVMA
ncbi:MAG: aldose epimerase family protein [Rikenellaceae bacterium]